ncbi:hypothetical protein [Sorangium sp. So ce1182]|uniref:hypothetical protein n=1 Tax=Sorangium sp. So ce1182 TaxID=3133334 RepID=UPI003F5F312E
MNRATFATFSLAAIMTLGIGTASAAPPPDCARGPGADKYLRALKAQSRYLHNLFTSYYGCYKLEQFAETVNRLTAGASITDECQGAGLRDAATDTISKVTKQCLNGNGSPPEAFHDTARAPLALDPGAFSPALLPVVSCSQDGKAMGRIAAQFYCAPPDPGAAIGRTPICDSIAAFYCRQAFDAYVLADDRCRAKSQSDPNYRKLIDVFCDPVTAP